MFSAIEAIKLLNMYDIALSKVIEGKSVTDFERRHLRAELLKLKRKACTIAKSNQNSFKLDDVPEDDF